MQRAVGSGPGRRVTQAVRAADSRRPQPVYLCLWPQKELGTKHRELAEKELLFRKTGRREVKSHSPLRIRCAEVLEDVKGTSVDCP